jgi:cob(I)alamin adenosyltransferase
VLFPKEEEREKGAKRMLDLWLDDPTATYIKVVDTETGKFQAAVKNLADFIVLGLSSASEYLLTCRLRENH